MSRGRPNVRRRGGWRRLLAVVGVLALVAAVALGLLVASALRDPTARFAERRSRLVHVEETPAELIEGHWVHEARLTAASGLRVQLLVKRPLADSADGSGARQGAPRPLAVILGGHQTGRDAVRLIPDTRGTVVAALAYPYHGDHRVKGLAVVGAVPAIREGILDTPPAVMLALDYLLAEPGIDSTRVEAVGVSLGAPFMTIAGALDERVTRVWAVHGSAGVYGPLEHNLRRSIPVKALRAPVGGLAALLVQGPRMAPERWAPRIAPRPFVMINARDDTQMPRHLVDRLYESAGEPKTMIWVPGGHVRARPEIVRPLVDTVLAGVLASPGARSGAAPAQPSSAATGTARDGR
jgi:hypothetical protein